MSAHSFSKFSSFILINYLLLLGCGLMWGSLYFLNKVALASFSTSMIAAGGTSIGAVTLTLVFLIGGERAQPTNPPRSFWQCFPDFIVIGLLELTLPALLITWAEEKIPSSATAILIGTVPLFATLMEALFIKGNTLSATKIVGIIFGFLGIIILARGGCSIADLLTATTQSLPLLPILAVLGAALCYPITLLLIKTRLEPNLGPIHAAQGILLGAVTTAVPLMLFITKPWRMTSFHPLPSAWLALILIGIFCEGLVYIFYIRLINRAGLSFASTCNYLTPLIGSFIGIFFAGEKMTLALIEALLLILFSLWLSGRKKAEG
jgi:drug/metabolite transporter (DMT)-like permease